VVARGPSYPFTSRSQDRRVRTLGGYGIFLARPTTPVTGRWPRRWRIRKKPRFLHRGRSIICSAARRRRSIADAVFRDLQHGCYWPDATTDRRGKCPLVRVKLACGSTKRTAESDPHRTSNRCETNRRLAQEDLPLMMRAEVALDAVAPAAVSAAHGECVENHSNDPTICGGRKFPIESQRKMPAVRHKGYRL
jgi:hypothetical protein